MEREKKTPDGYQITNQETDRSPRTGVSLRDLRDSPGDQGRLYCPEDKTEEEEECIRRRQRRREDEEQVEEEE